MMFRDRHPQIINAVVKAVKASGLTPDKLAAIAQDTSDDYITDIPEDAGLMPAGTALYCMENPVKYLHVPETVEKTDADGRESISYDEKDVEAVAAFAGNDSECA